MKENGRTQRERKPILLEDTNNDISAIPYAGTNQIRFNGYDLRPCATPAYKRVCVTFLLKKETTLVNLYLSQRNEEAVGFRIFFRSRQTYF